MSRHPGLFSKLAYLLGRQGVHRAYGLLVLMLVGALMEGVSLGLITPFIGLLGNPGFIHRERHLQWVYQTLHMNSDREFLIKSAFVILIVFILKNVYLALATHVQYLFTYNRLVMLARRLFGAYLSSSYEFHLSRNSAELIRNLSTDAVIVFHHVVGPLMVLVSEVIVGLLILSVLVAANPPVAVTAFLTIGGAAWVFYRFVRPRLIDVGESEQYYNGQTVKWISQGLGSIKEATILGRRSFILARFDETSYHHSRALLFYQDINQAPRFFIETLAVSILLLVAILLLMQEQTSAMIPTLALFALGAFRLMPTLNRIVNIVTSIKYRLPSVDVVYRDLKQLADGDLSNEITVPMAFDDEIELRSLSFKYPTASDYALKDISLTIPKGSSVAFVGPSGAGKTTLIDVVLGLLNPGTGQILVDGVGIESNKSGWQRNIGYIPQNIYLLDDSIRRNVAFGLPDEQVNDDQVWNALRMAQLETLIRKLPAGLDSQTGERGVSLSGGERQRIGIARALYANPEVLVLDEATSSLDTETEFEITQAIERLGRIKTLIIIAHRLTTVKACDTIYLIRDGKLAGRVSYDQLTASGFNLNESERSDVATSNP